MDRVRFAELADHSRETGRKTVQLRVKGKSDAEMQKLWADQLVELAREPAAESKKASPKALDGTDAMVRGGLTLFMCRLIAAGSGTVAQLADAFRTERKAVKAIKNGTHWSSRYIAPETIVSPDLPPKRARRPASKVERPEDLEPPPAPKR